MNPTLPRLIGIVLSCGLLTGCLIVTPHQEVMPALTLDCVVRDTATSRPIPGASLQLLYVGPNGEQVMAGAALTDQDGKAQLRTDSQTIAMRGSDWYFAGGYYRLVSARARGYEHRVSDEGFQKEKFDTGTPLQFSLSPVRNHYGAGLVKAEQATGSVRTLTFEILDGPRAGETISLPFHMPQELPSCLGKTLYFLRSIREIENRVNDDGAQACDSETFFGEALRDEPYTEVVRKFGEVTDAQELNNCVYNMLRFIPGKAPGTTEVTAIRSYIISTLDRRVDWLQFTCDAATLATLKKFRWMEPVPTGTNKERPGTPAAESPPDTPSWWTALAVPPVMEEYQYNRSIPRERADRLIRIWIDPINQKVYAQGRWVL